MKKELRKARTRLLNAQAEEIERKNSAHRGELREEQISHVAHRLAGAINNMKLSDDLARALGAALDGVLDGLRRESWRA